MSGTTPIRKALVNESPLRSLVHDGLGALKKVDKGYIEEEIRAQFADSLDIDAAFEKGHETENRWDYLLGHDESGRIFGLEPHTANDGGVPVVIKKRERSREHLRTHLKQGVQIADWFWVASGKVDFTAQETTTLRLAQNGITFVGKQLLAKRLGSDPKSSGKKAKKK